MKETDRERILENLVASALIALIGVLAATAIYGYDRGEILRERSALSELAASPNWVKAGESKNPSYRRIYRLVQKGRRRYGAVLAVGSASGRDRLALLFSAEGELEAALSLGASRRTSPLLREEFLALFLGRGAEKPFPRVKADLSKPDAASGATRSLSELSLSLSRLSETVRALEKE